MSNTYEYTFDEYPNIKVITYKGVDDTFETNLDKILSNLVIGKNKYGHTTVSFDTVDKYVDISYHNTYDKTGKWFTIQVLNSEYNTREYSVEINIKKEDGMNTMFYSALKFYYECVIVDNDIFTNILK